MHTNAAELERIAAAATACRLCPRVREGSAAAGAAGGKPGAAWLFVGEAPGRLGAGRTGIPFLGDEAGRRFESLLAEAGLVREAVFVTNALLCLPLDAAGRNRTPGARELRACAPFLAATIAAMSPAVVVALGAVALRALGAIDPHGLSLAGDAGRRVPWGGRELVALYHPSRQAELHRPWAEQVADWRALGRG